MNFYRLIKPLVRENSMLIASSPICAEIGVDDNGYIQLAIPSSNDMMDSVIAVDKELLDEYFVPITQDEFSEQLVILRSGMKSSWHKQLDKLQSDIALQTSKVWFKAERNEQKH